MHNATDNIYKCSLEENCLGGTENFTCKAGHIGFIKY